MKILLISFAFPPFNASGSVRMGKLAAYLVKRGHDVRVIAGEGLSLPRTLDVEITESAIHRCAYRRVTTPIDVARQWMARRSGDRHLGSDAPDPWARKLVNIYRAIVAIPDSEIGWYFSAVATAKAAVSDWMPDVILSSALPFTSHLVASKLARLLKRPWVADFRDLFADNPYADAPSWRRAVDRLIERRVIATATACVTISEPLAETLTTLHGKPTIVVMNGYDPDDYPLDVQPPRGPGRPLRILYTGIIYPGRRDPTPLFQAMRMLGDRARRIVVDFYGQDLRGVRAAAVDAGMSDQVHVHGPVPYAQSLRLQCEADALLLLLWDDPRERGVFTGKLFEYIGADRPILVIGCADGVAASVIRERGLGVSTSKTSDVAKILEQWITRIDNIGYLAAPNVEARHEYSRSVQFAKLESLLVNSVARPRRMDEPAFSPL